MLSWLYKQIMKNRRRPRPIVKPKSIFLSVEVLESRLAPAAFQLTGKVGSLWSNPNNWLANGAKTLVPPGPADDVQITGNVASDQDIPGLTIQSLNVDAAFTNTLTLDQPLTVNGEPTDSVSTIAAGSIILSGTGSDLTFNSMINWTGGSIGGVGGITKIMQDVTMNIYGDSAKTLSYGELWVYGTADWTGSGSILLVQSALRIGGWRDV